MARQRTQYRLAGRYLRGNDTVYYGLVTVDGKEVRATEEVMAYYVGRDQVINVKAQLYKDKVLFRGIGCEIRDLPTIQLGNGNTGGPKPVQPKPVQPKPVNKHKLSDKIVRDISGYTDTKIQSNYEDAINTLLSKYSSLAYKLEKTLYFKDMRELGCKVHLYKSDGDVHYILTNIWESADYELLAVSTTTLQLLQYEYPELVTRFNGDASTASDLSQYKYCHYHELVIRLGMFSRIPQYKKLKMQFVRYNKEIFDNKITPKMVMIVGEYKEGTKFDDLEDCAGYSRKAIHNINNYPLIIVKYKHFMSVDYIDNLSRANLCTLLHEMSHAYVDELYETNWESNPEDMGDVLYGINKLRHPEQYRSHGRKFGTVVEMVSAKTGFSFDEIFHYGVKVSNSKRNTKYTRTVGHDYIKYDNITDLHYTDKDMHKRPGFKGWIRYNEKFSKLKSALCNNKEFFSDYFRQKFNIELSIVDTEDDTRINTVDRFGNTRNYDLNFDYSSRTKILLYRMMDGTNYMLYQAVIGMSDDKEVIKRVLEKVYMDTLNN